MKRLLLVFTCFLFLVSSVSAYELEFYHADHLGSPVVVTKENQSVVWSSDYDVFGETINEVGDNSHKYNQKEKDDTGLLYYGARYYNPDTGRFITADTVKGSMTDLQSQNLYIYVKNNPMRYIDPTGNQFSESDTRATINIYVQKKWYDVVKNDLAEVRSVASQTGIPGEAILAAILVEDIRFYNPEESEMSWSTIKSSIRQATPNWILTAAGHNPNPTPGESYYGMVWSDAEIGSNNYLNSLTDLDAGTKALLDKGISEQTQIETVALALKSHAEYWKRSGFDIFSQKFDSISTFGERVGVLETLNNIFAYKDTNSVSNFDGPGFYSFRGRKVSPHNSPALGGYNVGWSDYGTISKEFVDSGLATEMLKTE